MLVGVLQATESNDEWRRYLTLIMDATKPAITPRVHLPRTSRQDRKLAELTRSRDRVPILQRQ
jgi:hypothetical protein